MNTITYEVVTAAEALAIRNRACGHFTETPSPVPSVIAFKGGVEAIVFSELENIKQADPKYGNFVCVNIGEGVNYFLVPSMPVVIDYTGRTDTREISNALYEATEREAAV